MCNCYVICSDKEVLDSAKIPGVSLECNFFLGATKQGNVCIPGVILIISLVSNIDIYMMFSSPQEWIRVCP